MRVHTYTVIDIETGKILEDSFYDYDGPVALANRSAAGQAKTAAGQAQSTAGTLETEGQAIQSTVVPELTRELQTQHLFAPDQLNEILTAAGAGAGGATAGLTGGAELEAARTRNTAGFAPALDALARQRMQTMAKTSEGVAAEDVTGAIQQRQKALSGLAQYGQADIGDALKAMGLQTQDIGTEIEAGKSGWFQNMTGLISALGGAKKGPLSYV